MANPHKRGKSWEFVYYTYKYENGKRTRKQHKKGGYTTKEEAEKDLRIFKAKLELGIIKDYSNETVDSYIDRWFNWHKNTLAPSTANGYKVNIEHHIIPYIGGVKLKNLKPADIRALYEQLLEKGLSAKSVHYVHNTLNSALTAAADDGIIERNVCAKIKLPKVERYKAQTLTLEQVRILWEGLSGNLYRNEIKIAILLGLRRGEVLGLKNSDVDFNKHTISIQRQVTVTRNNTQKDKGEYFGIKGLKTDSSNRILGISSEIEEMIIQQQRLNRLQKQENKELYIDNDLLFCDKFGGCLNPQTLYKNFKRVLIECELPVIRFHDLRHTFATLSVDLGVPEWIVSKSMGHTKQAITYTVYNHSNGLGQQIPERLSKAINGN